MNCLNCGKEIADDSKFCEFCGVKVEKKQPRLRTYAFLRVLILCVVLAVAIIIVWGRSSQVFGSSGSHSQHDYVDLGLSVMWATCNVGAVKPSEPGRYFAWGELRDKVNDGGYFWSTYLFCLNPNVVNTTLSKYLTELQYANREFVDNKTVLDFDDDVAHVQWGGTWRIPTESELNELIDNCRWKWIKDRDGMCGYEITSKKPGYKKNSIFLPASGVYDGEDLLWKNEEGFYWTSTLDSSYSVCAKRLLFHKKSKRSENFEIGYRLYGQSIRPVCTP